MKYITIDGTVAVVKVSGIYGTQNVRAIEDEFSKAQENGCINIMYDFTNTKAVESVGLTSIIKMNRKIKNKPKIKNANELIMRLIEASAMKKDFEFVE